MSGIITLHNRLVHFVDWLAPAPGKEKAIRAHAKHIRDEISSQARADGLTICSTPNAGSFEKHTGLRRHITGGSNVEGLDVDLVFVVAPQTANDKQLKSLLNRFARYAAHSFPNNAPTRTKSSVKLSFKRSKLQLDLVPMLATSQPDRQILIRAHGTQVETSIQSHIKFIRRRTDASNQYKGRVKFNECIRLVKWWRTFRQSKTSIRVPSFVIDLLCAHAFDACRVQGTYAETLEQWFRHMASTVGQRRRVAFADEACPIPRRRSGAAWDVLDPINPRNNVVAKWSVDQVSLFAQWLEQAHAHWLDAIHYAHKNQDVESRRSLIELFGTPIKHHCGA